MVYSNLVKVISSLVLISSFGCGDLRYVTGDRSETQNNTLRAPEEPDRPSETVPEVDTDNDGLSDDAEARLGTDPNNQDSDGDGISDGAEYNSVGTDPLLADTDNGGVNDGDELKNGTNPINNPGDDFPTSKPIDKIDKTVDTDGDGIDDNTELDLGTDPTNPDTDNDGLSDGDERSIGTDPLKADTDNGGVNDGDEIKAGTNPIDDPTDDFQISCDQEFTMETWAQGSQEKKKLRHFVGTLSAKKNYNYKSFSANPIVGPQPENDVLYIYLYKSPAGMSLFFHANANNSENQGFEKIDVEFNIKTSSDYTPDLLESDEFWQTKNLGGGKFLSKMKHWRNSDGGVIGHLGANFEISIDILRSSHVKQVIVGSNVGDNKVEKIELLSDVRTQKKTIHINSKVCE